MANVGFFCLDGYLDRLARLSDEDVGKIFRACMLYHKTGEITDLGDCAGMAFDFIRADIDAANDKYAEKCKKNRENVEKRWADTTEYDRMRSNTIVSCAIRTNTVEAKENRNIKGNVKEKESLVDDDEAHAIQIDQDRVLDAAEDAGFKMSNDVRAALIALYADHGLEKVLDGLKSCVDHGAPNLAYLRACMKGGGKDAGAHGSPTGKVKSAYSFLDNAV